MISRPQHSSHFINCGPFLPHLSFWNSLFLKNWPHQASPHAAVTQRVYRLSIDGPKIADYELVFSIQTLTYGEIQLLQFYRNVQPSFDTSNLNSMSRFRSKASSKNDWSFSSHELSRAEMAFSARNAAALGAETQDKFRDHTRFQVKTKSIELDHRVVCSCTGGYYLPVKCQPRTHETSSKV